MLPEYEDSFEITDPISNIVSMGDLYNKIELQFNTLPGDVNKLDRTDYVKLFITKIIGVSEADFPNLYGSYINDDNRFDYHSFLLKIQFHLANIFGIYFDQESDKLLEMIYNVYYFIMIKPDVFIKDYLLYYHMYKDNYDIVSFYRNYKVNSNIILGDIFEVDPVQYVNNVRDVLYKQIKEKKQFNTLTYNERFNVFMEYCRNIFGDMNEFEANDIFNKVNIMSPNDNYEFLSDQIDIFNAIRFESNALFAEELYKRNFDVSHQESYINDRLITPFFKHLDSLDYYVKKAMIGEL